MWHTLLNWPWGTVWSAVSALGSIVTVTLGFWAMNVWRRQEALKAKMALKMAVADYSGNDSNLLIVFYVQIMPDDFVMQLHRF